MIHYIKNITVFFLYWQTEFNKLLLFIWFLLIYNIRGCNVFVCLSHLKLLNLHPLIGNAIVSHQKKKKTPLGKN